MRHFWYPAQNYYFPKKWYWCLRQFKTKIVAILKMAQTCHNCPFFFFLSRVYFVFCPFLLGTSHDLCGYLSLHIRKHRGSFWIPKLRKDSLDFHTEKVPKRYIWIGVFWDKVIPGKKKKKEKDIYIYEPLLKTDSNTIKNNVIIIMILFVGEKYLSLRFVAFWQHCLYL